MDSSPAESQLGDSSSAELSHHCHTVMGGAHALQCFARHSGWTFPTLRDALGLQLPPTA